MLDKWDFFCVIYMFLSNNPSSGDINSSNLSCFFFIWPYVFWWPIYIANNMDADQTAPRSKVNFPNVFLGVL